LIEESNEMALSYVQFRLSWLAVVMLSLGLANPTWTSAQERRAKLRISNAGFTITALPLLAAKDWEIFNVKGTLTIKRASAPPP
jgi:hypothetical protein